MKLRTLTNVILGFVLLASSQAFAVKTITDAAPYKPAKATSRIFMDVNLSGTSIMKYQQFNQYDEQTYHVRLDTPIYDAKGHSDIASVYATKRIENGWEINVVIDDYDVARGIVSFDHENHVYKVTGLQNITWYPVASKPVTFSVNMINTTQFRNIFSVRDFHADGNAPKLLTK